jgi:putative glutamine amidotransferase
MKPRIAIPQPHSQKREYNERTFPQYARAVEAAGGEPVEVPLDSTPEEIARIASTCQGVLLPGSPADVDPQKFNEKRHDKTSPADPQRDNVDELLLQDAFNMRKPLLGICYGLQSLNVWRTGTLVQHLDSRVNHEAGKAVPIAHQVKLEPASRLAKIIAETTLPVNSSHHQAAAVVGDGLRAVATCTDDGVIEAIEGTSPEHFVLGVQWHPERGAEKDPASQRIFQNFVAEAKKYRESDRPRHS